MARRRRKAVKKVKEEDAEEDVTTVDEEEEQTTKPKRRRKKVEEDEDTEEDEVEEVIDEEDTEEDEVEEVIDEEEEEPPKKKTTKKTKKKTSKKETKPSVIKKKTTSKARDDNNGSFLTKKGMMREIKTRMEELYPDSEIPLKLIENFINEYSDIVKEKLNNEVEISFLNTHKLKPVVEESKVVKIPLKNIHYDILKPTNTKVTVVKSYLESKENIPGYQKSKSTFVTLINGKEVKLPMTEKVYEKLVKTEGLSQVPDKIKKDGGKKAIAALKK